MNRLFEQFLFSYDFENLYNQDAGEVKLKSSLPGQELLVFSLLSSMEGAIVTKEEIANEIWGDAWEEKYSNWAIDKLISTLRKRLKQENYPKTITSVKGRGFILN